MNVYIRVTNALHHRSCLWTSSSSTQQILHIDITTIANTDDPTYGIRGLPRPDDAVKHTKQIPYVEGLPTIFVLALERFKLKPVNEKLSYFQVAGIHGYPEVAWDNAPAPKQDPDPTKVKPGDQPFGGYCNHNGLNFPTWHRPYMALFEQCIWENMKEVIDHWVNNHGLPTEEGLDWLAAADTWRMPYWDWARQQSYTEDFAYPKILVQGPVRIFPPDAVKQYYPPSGLYANPFWGFEIPEKDKHGNPLPFGKMPKGKRDWNIEDDLVQHDPAPPQDATDVQWIPWSMATGTSRYGLFVSKTGKRFRGLEGVNNAWAANRNLSTMKENDRWYTIQKYKAQGFEWNPGTLADSVNRMYCKKRTCRPKYWLFVLGVYPQQRPRKSRHPECFEKRCLIHLLRTLLEALTTPRELVICVTCLLQHSIQSSGSITGESFLLPFNPILSPRPSQIDRLQAIWQSLNWDLWWDQNEAGGDNVRDDQPEGFLYPFHTKDNGDREKDVWTAEACRDWTVFNYQYDDLMDLSQKALLDDGTNNEEKFKELLLAYINQTYPSTGQLIEDTKCNGDLTIPDGLELPGGDRRNKPWNDYIINVVYDRYALEGRSYTIKFYLGGPNDTNETRYERQNFVGQVYTFGGGVRCSKDSCKNCKTQADKNVLSCGQVPLTIQLLHHTIDHIKDHSIKNFDVAQPQPVTSPLVVEDLYAVQISALEVNLAEMIETAEASEIGDLASRTKEPIIMLPPLYSDYQLLPEITEGKRYGLRSDELVGLSA
ncbi:Fc.00g097160.m01.CDS01 [Cosmosporella sp. VM-42]